MNADTSPTLPPPDGWEPAQLKSLLAYERPDKFVVKSTDYTLDGETPVLTANKTFELGFTTEDFGIRRDLPVIIFDDFTTDSKYVTFAFKVKSSAIKLLTPKHDQVDLRFVFARMQLIRFPVAEHKRYYISEYQNIEITVPALPEQRAIAEALSDVDALLAALDRLIAKKRAIKLGAMQQLLTGRMRLPGYDGEWTLAPLGQLAEVISGGTPDTHLAHYWDGNIPWCTPTDITANHGKYLRQTERTITTLGLRSCAATLLPPGSLLLCSRATIGEIRIATHEICTNQGFKSLVCRPDVSNEFLYYLLVTKKQQLVQQANGSTFLEVGKHAVAALEINLPSLLEQAAIASILSDMDAEIAALERRRAKTEDIKHGMMQQLLTGRTRLA